MAEQSVTLQPSESKVISFEAIPHEAKALTLVVGDGFSVVSFDNKKFIQVGVDPDGKPYGVLSEPAKVVSTYVTNTMPWTIHWELAPPPTMYPWKYFCEGKLRFIGKPDCKGCGLSYSEGWSGKISGGPGTVWKGITRCIGPYRDTCGVKGTCYGDWNWQFWREEDGLVRKVGGSFRIKNLMLIQ